MNKAQFTQSVHDLSTEAGFQFEFLCDRCGRAYVSDLKPVESGATLLWTDNVKGSSSGGLGAGSAGSLGSVSHFMNTAKDRMRADIGDERRDHSPAWQKKHATTFTRAIQDAKQHFHKCKQCGHWVDSVCWSDGQKLCKDCAG